MLPNAIQENRVKRGEDPDETNGDILVPIHDLIDQIDEYLRNDFKHELWFEVFGGIGHYH